MVVALIATILVAWRTLLYEPKSPIDFSWVGEFIRHFNQNDNPFWSRDIAIFVVVVFMWWRGISLIGRSVDIGEVGLRLRTSILLAVFFVAGLAGSQLEWPVTPFILLFFFSSLIAIVLTRVEQLERARSGHSFPLGPRWMLAVVGAAALVVFLTGIITGFISGQSINDAVGALSPLWLAITYLASTALMTLALLSEPLLVILSWLFKLIFDLIDPVLGSGLGDFLDAFQPPAPTTIPEELTDSTSTAIQFPRQLLPPLIMLFFVLLVSLTLGRLFRTMRQPTQTDSEGLSPLSDIGELRSPGIGRRLLERLSLLRRWRTAASIRHVYREMCQKASHHGFPRTISETPYEYLDTLAQAWPNNGSETTLITEAFIRVRYGELPETQQELNDILASWKRLEETPLVEGHIKQSDIQVQHRRK